MGLGNAYGPAGTGSPFSSGHTSASTRQRAPSSTARRRTMERPSRRAYANVELATRGRLESRLAHRRAWATACAIVPESVTEKVLVTTPGRLTTRTAGSGSTPAFATSAATAALVECADAYEAGAACLRGGTRLAPHDRVNGSSRNRDADDDDPAVAQGVVDPRGKAARDARVRLRVCCRPRAGRFRGRPRRRVRNRRGIRRCGRSVAERAATDEEDDGRETGQHERADERRDACG